MKKILYLVLAFWISCSGMQRFSEDFDVMSSPPLKMPISLHHFVIDFYDCFIPEDKVVLEAALREAAIKASATPLEFVSHRFEPYGLSAMLILAESHIALHYWPEDKYAAIDIFTCGRCNPLLALAVLKEKFIPGAVELKEVPRPIKDIK